MTILGTIDPGGSTGWALGFYDDTTPYTLLERGQVLGGVEGFVRWVLAGGMARADRLVVESFILAMDNDFSADLTPVHIEGAIVTLQLTGAPNFPGYVTAWHPRTRKGDLTGYPPGMPATDTTGRQRVRFDFLERFGLFAAGTQNDDSNDAITHALVYLKGIGHGPTKAKYWPDRHSDAQLDDADDWTLTGGF